MPVTPADHWDDIYATRPEGDLGWFEEVPATLPDVLAVLDLEHGSLIDIGAGASHLVDELVDRDVADITLLDISTVGLDIAAARLGDRGTGIERAVTDLLDFRPARTWQVWHDRATFHFITEPEGRRAYAEVLDRALEPGGYAVIAAFAEDGPAHCAGLPVVRYSEATLAAELADVVECRGCRRHAPDAGDGDVRPYLICTFQKPTDRPEPGRREES